jgi:hypothetical protein
VLHLALETQDDTVRFFGQYSEALEIKHKMRTALYRRPNFFQFQTDTGGVFLRCMQLQCLVVEGATRATFDAINRAIGWPAAPGPVEDKPSVAQLRASTPAEAAGSSRPH